MVTLLIVPAVLLDGVSVPAWQRLGVALNWATWLALLAHVLIVAAVAGTHGLRVVWFDLLLVAVTAPFAPSGLQAARMVRLIRVVRVGIALTAAFRHVRAVLRHRQFHIVALVAGIAVVLGAFGIYSVEFDANPNIRSLGDAFWWAVVTSTTVGYGDISPVTTEGRIIAIVLMLVGIGVIGAFTATVASFFVAQGEAPDLAQIEAKLARLETKLDLLLAQEGTQLHRLQSSPTATNDER